MKSQVNRPGYASAFATRSWARFSPDQRHAAVGQRAELLERDVLDRGEDLHLVSGASGRRDLLAHALQVRAHPLRAQTPDQVNHAIPAWRPVIPLSRRCEKNRLGSEQIVQSSASWTLATPAATSCMRATAFRSRRAPRRASAP